MKEKIFCNVDVNEVMIGFNGGILWLRSSRQQGTTWTAIETSGTNISSVIVSMGVKIISYLIYAPLPKGYTTSSYENCIKQQHSVLCEMNTA